MAKQQQPSKSQDEVLRDYDLARVKFKRDQFIKALAIFLVKNDAGKGIAMRMPAGLIPWALEWAELRNASPVFGYATIPEAEKKLREFFGWL